MLLNVLPNFSLTKQCILGNDEQFFVVVVILTKQGLKFIYS